ncbi:MAG: DUF11 domain-containing protein [Chloroflexi bacterium]|nr:DUF11 domain-containing protein [Chloroflexota bacterium]
MIGGGLTPLIPEGDPPPINDVYYAQILSDGRLSDWKLTSLLPDPLTLHTAVVTNSTIYVVGGYNGKNNNSLSADTFYATIQSDGSLSAWTRSATKLPIGISLLTAVIKGDYIYVIGGYDTTSIVSLKSVYRARILAGGDISGWERLLDMSQSNYRHTSEIYKDKLYVIGGRERQGGITKPLNSIYIGQISPDGRIGSWIPTEFLPQNLYFHGSVISRDERKIYTFGGYDGNSATDKVYSTLIKTDGSLEPWVEVSNLKLPKPLFRHSVVLADNGSVYLLGGKYNNLHINETYFIPPLALTKSSDPPDPIHEGDTITYTIAYTNNSLITQTMTITDLLPFNATLIPDSVSPPATPQGSTLVWNLGDIPPGGQGQVSFKMHVPLLPSLDQASRGVAALAASPPGYVIPISIACDTTRFWANGVTAQPPPPIPYTLQVQFPPDASLSQMWLLMKETGNISPTINDQPAELVKTSHNNFGASLWSTSITPEMLASGQATIVTQQPRNLNAFFLFDRDDPPFVETTLDDFFHTTKTLTYTFDLPSVITQTMDVILPLMDVNLLIDSSLPDNRVTTVTMQFAGQSHTVIANDPNLGNGLLMVQIPFDLGSIPGAITGTRVLTVSVDTEDSVYMLGPRVCRPVYIVNTAWLCSEQAGCISDMVINTPPNLKYLEIYLPIIKKP